MWGNSEHLLKFVAWLVPTFKIKIIKFIKIWFHQNKGILKKFCYCQNLNSLKLRISETWLTKLAKVTLSFSRVTTLKEKEGGSGNKNNFYACEKVGSSRQSYVQFWRTRIFLGRMAPDPPTKLAEEGWLVTKDWTRKTLGKEEIREGVSLLNVISREEAKPSVKLICRYLFIYLFN